MLDKIVQAELAILLALLVVLVILWIWKLLRELVIVPGMTVAVDKAHYFKEETVAISGTVMDGSSPVVGESVGFAIQPPTGDAYIVPPTTTDSGGAFTASWVIPLDAESGTYTLTAAGAGVAGTTTFILGSVQINSIHNNFVVSDRVSQLIHHSVARNSIELYCPQCGTRSVENEQEAMEGVWTYHPHYCQHCGCSFKVLRPAQGGV